MKIVQTRVFRGRNIYSHKPCIRADIDLEEYWDTPTCDITNFNNLLLEYIPTLKDHKCSRGYKGGFVERLYEGTYMAHVIEHMCIEIQNILGYDVAYGKARQTDVENIYYIVFQFKSEVAAMEVLNLVLELVNDICKGIKRIVMTERLASLKAKVSKLELGPSTLAIKTEAQLRGIPILTLGRGSLLQLGYGTYSKKIQATITENTSCIGVDISCDKEMTKNVLSMAGIPVPEGYLCEEFEEVLRVVDSLGYPIVIKPNNGNQGKGVSLNLKNSEDIAEAFKIAKGFSKEVIVERYVEGRHYRVLVVNNKVVACAERISAHVVGNGVNTIKELIDMENHNPLRGEEHEKPLTKIKVDSVMDLLLKKNNMTLDYIPKEKELIYLRENDNLSTGGIAIDVTDEIHEDNANIAINCAQTVGLDVAGIDITTNDISKSMIDEGGAVIEVNAAPGIRMHHYPTKGKKRNVAKEIVNMLFPEESKLTIPIASVTGTNGKTTTTRMLGRILKEAGYRVGMTTTGGVYIDDKCIMRGDTTGPASAQSVLMNNTVDAAVLETARGGIVNRGLGYDLADVGIITNITEDHLGIDGINTLDDLAHVKALVVEAVKDNGYAVLNADDQYCAKIAMELNKEIILFSTKPSNPVIETHILKGGKAVFLKKEDIVYFDGRKETNIIDIKNVPSTLSGILEYNVKNALAAVAGAIGLNIETSSIIEGLKNFTNDHSNNPGRFNMYNVGNFKVIVDYGHNIDGFKEVISSLRKMKYNRLIGVIGVPGDRSETSTVKIGQVSGENFDYILIKEDKDLRGREPGEVAKFLKNGCIIGGFEKEKIEIELCEEKATKKAMLMAQENDIVVVFYEDYEGVKRTIEETAEIIFSQQSENQNEIKLNA